MRFPVLLACVLLFGCGNPMRHKVVGLWTFDVSSLKGPQVDLAKKLDGWKKREQELANAHVGFQSDGTMDAEILGRREEGRWEVKGHDLVLTATSPADQANLPAMKINDDATRIHMKAPGGAYEVDLIRDNR